MSVLTEINRIKDAVTAIVAAIKGKGVTVPSGTKIDGLASLVSSIPQLDTSDANATAAQILSGKTAYVKGSKVTGTMTNREGHVIQLSYDHRVEGIPKGFHDGNGIAHALVENDRTYTPRAAGWEITAQPGYFLGKVIINGDNNFKPEIIKKDETVFGLKGTYEGGASIETCTVVLDVSSHDWYSSNKVRVFYTAYGDGLSAEYIETTASNTPEIYLYNVVCGSAIYLYTEVYCLHSPNYTRFTDEFHHCIVCPHRPGETVTITLTENS